MYSNWCNSWSCSVFTILKLVQGGFPQLGHVRSDHVCPVRYVDTEHVSLQSSLFLWAVKLRVAHILFDFAQEVLLVDLKRISPERCALPNISNGFVATVNRPPHGGYQSRFGGHLGELRDKHKVGIQVHPSGLQVCRLEHLTSELHGRRDTRAPQGRLTCKQLVPKVGAR